MRLDAKWIDMFAEAFGLCGVAHEVMQRMTARIPGAEFTCLAGAGHIAHVERPAAFNDAVVSFLQRHFPAS